MVTLKQVKRKIKDDPMNWSVHLMDFVDDFRYYLGQRCVASIGRAHVAGVRLIALQSARRCSPQSSSERRLAKWRTQRSNTRKRLCRRCCRKTTSGCASGCSKKNGDRTAAPRVARLNQCLTLNASSVG